MTHFSQYVCCAHKAAASDVLACFSRVESGGDILWGGGGVFGENTELETSISFDCRGLNKYQHYGSISLM